jgi:hypothetical protein
MPARFLGQNGDTMAGYYELPGTEKRIFNTDGSVVSCFQNQIQMSFDSRIGKAN